MLDRLSLDVVDIILTSLPDFSTLWSTIQVSQHVHGVFKARPTSIMTAVAHSQLGPHLSEAIRIVRLKHAGADAQSPLLNDEGPETAVSDWRVARALETVATTVKAYEIMFSRRHKDRSRNASALSESESFRFQRALFHYWMYQARFGKRWRETDEADPIDDDGWDDDEPEPSNAERDGLIQQQKQYLANHISQVEQKRELAAFFMFLAETLAGFYRSVDHPHADSQRSMLLTLALDDVMNVIETRDIALFNQGTIVLYPQSLNNFVWDAMDQLNLEQKDVNWRAILDDVIGENDICSMCQEVRGLELYNETNWDMLRGVLSPSQLSYYLQGNLKRNAVETQALKQKLAKDDFNFSALMHAIFEESPNLGAWNGSKSAWLCTECLTGTFWPNNLHLWWLHRKQDDGIVIKEDCRYGYNCRTQTHSQSHAQKLNHLCDATRGDRA
ncbi:hypothetical protein FA95DRAFT_1597442 [Auriscalpium vulgare]|uniref:Uncharacterized protein n=1 Tax=Auriscalpium vulgare TaxID=40419 RepID=A0ACB8RJF8_9AGAM|nr:hypothetical protein FA95DRAFT_1597442 [Auriscalpium vulgare]